MKRAVSSQRKVAKANFSRCSLASDFIQVCTCRCCGLFSLGEGAQCLFIHLIFSTYLLCAGQCQQGWSLPLESLLV